MRPRPLHVFATLVIATLGAACSGDPATVAPDPAELAGDEIGYYCNMIVVAHQGPKGQVFLADREQPLWFTSARDTIAFTRLPEEPKNISAVYVSDMGAASWDMPEPGTWVEARDAWFVVGSNKVGGMGAPEPVPFALRDKAEAFRGAARGAGGRFRGHPRRRDSWLRWPGGARRH